MKKADLILDINSNIVPVMGTAEHRASMLPMVNEMFPDFVKVEWDGTASISPTTDIIVYPSLATGIVKFTIRFWKSGNDVYFNGMFENYSAGAVANIQLIEWNTSLFEPLTTCPVIVLPEVSNSGSVVDTPFRIKVTSQGLYLFGNSNPSINVFSFYGNYKVAN